MTRLILTLCSVALLLPTSAASAASPCDGLTGAARATAEELLGSLTPYACCDDTLETCLKDKPSKLVRRLADGVCRQVDGGADADTVKKWLAERKASLVSGKTHSFATEPSHWAGDAKAPVEVVVYACARCPYCSMSVVPSHRAIAEGPLSGKAKLAYRLFPLKNHEHAVDAALAYEVARGNGKYWDYILHTYAKYDDVTPQALVSWAGKAGLTAGDMEKGLKDKGVRKRVAASKREGIKNGVMGTPTYFIDGREYLGNMSPVELYDAVEEAWERKTGDICKP